ncbi:amino acid adenylation domain-containing protein [Scytonema sp. NUACC26]|uniref:amino acid adenylation domain-containing protein n=1 Tax=Scytonema sp. NUACC26 TaxID=3140176 RepID=UPI0034DBFAE7
MLALSKLIQEISEKNIKLNIEGDDLKVYVSQDVLTQDLIEGIKDNREFLIKFLRKHNSETDNWQIKSLPKSGDIQLSYAQKRFWFADKISQNKSELNIPFAYKITGRFNYDIFERSVRLLIERHESLRTRFPLKEAKPVQIILESLDGNKLVEYKDISLFSSEQKNSVLQNLLHHNANTPFDLQNEPLFRVRIAKLNEDEHLLLICLHHIIFDGWSVGVFNKELTIIYNSLLKSETAKLQPLQFQYSDFSQWQRDRTKRDDSTQELYWKKELEGCENSLLTIPTDYPRPSALTYCGDVHRFKIDRDLTQKLKQISSSCKSSMYNVLLAALNVMLYAYSQQETIIIGSPVANRQQSGLESQIGLFINTIALKTNLLEKEKFSELVTRVRKTSLAALENQDIPFERVVESIGANRSLSYNPIFQVMFAYQNTPVSKIDFSGCDIEAIETHVHGSQLDITISLFEEENKLRGEVFYSTDLFEKETISRLFLHFQNLLQQISIDPHRPISEYKIITPEEERIVHSVWNNTLVDYPALTLVDKIEQQVIATSKAVAVEFEEQKLTYEELNQKANQLARYLRKCGVDSETLVGVYMKRSVEMVVSLLAIIKAGGAYVPLDPDYPEERVRYTIQDSKISYLLSQKDLVPNLSEVEAQIILPEDPVIASESQDDLSLNIDPESTAYMIYTSGSTGRPKGVPNTHKGIYNRLCWMQSEFQLSQQDCVLQKTPFSFDVSVWEFFWPLMYGARIVVAKPGGHRDPSYLIKVINEKKVTTVHFVPSLLNVFLDDPDISTCKTLRQVFCSGEALPYQSTQKFYEKFKGCLLHNLYGPTEAAIDVSYWPCSPQQYGQKVPIGKPIANIQLYVLDKYLKIQPIGVAGELHIGGVGLAKGYYGREELTREKFIPNPFDPEGKGRLYKTGDLACYLPDGNIEYLGRIDNQIKLRGFRVEIGEIESCIREVNGVQEAVVTLYTTKAGSQMLVAYIVGDRSLEESDIKTFLAHQLPEFMIPSLFITLEALPLSPNGKLDRKNLPDPASIIVESEDFEKPHTPVESLLAEIWRKVLQVEKVSLQSNFFQLGGDSIHSIQVVALMKQQGFDISLQDIFKYQTLAKIAKQAKEVNKMYHCQVGAFILLSEEDRRKLPDDIIDAWPLSHLQSGMIYHSALHPDKPIYHDVFCFDIEGKYEIEAIKKALRWVLKKHPVLRSSFDLKSYSTTVQIIHSEVELPLEVQDLRALNQNEQEAQVERWVENEKNTPFEIMKAPLIHFCVFQHSDTFLTLGVGFHHAILDGWSLATVLSDFYQAYSAILDNEPLKTEENLLQFSSYVQLEQEALKDRQLSEFWKAQLVDFNFTAIPRLYSEQEQERFNTRTWGSIENIIDGEIFASLNSTAQTLGVPLKSLLLAVHIKVIGLIANQKDVTTGVVFNGRPEVLGGESLSGLFLNALPFRVLVKEQTWQELIQTVFEIERQIIPNRRFPLAEIQKYNGGEPYFESAFNFTDFHVYEKGANTKKLKVVRAKYFEQTNFTLLANFNVDRFSNNLKFMLNYDPEELSKEQVSRYAKYYLNVLNVLRSNLDESIFEFPLLAPEEISHLLPELPKQEQPSEFHTLKHHFEKAAKNFPNKIALTCGTQSLTYSELNARANQLAYFLKEKGVKPQSLIGIVFERSVEMIVAILATLKAGGAYIPLDPQAPKERISFISQDANLHLLLTQKSEFNLSVENGIPVIHYDAIETEVKNYPNDNLQVDLKPHHVAYVIYTSGSTGQPKGVLVNHFNVLRLFSQTQQNFEFNEKDTWTLFHSYAFDFSIWEMWGALLYGGRLVLVSYWISRSPDDFVNLVLSEKVTVLNQTPSAFQQFQNALLDKKDVEKTDLRYIIFGGEALDIPSLKPWFKRFGDKQPTLVNMYGITETTVHVTYRPIYAKDTLAPGSMIGVPIKDLEIYLLDEKQQPVPMGTPGEMYVAGGGVTLGYLNREKLTSERFVEITLPHSQEKMKVYRSGDLARKLLSGDIEYLGRIDHQVKINGFRIELGEIESVLKSLPQISTCAVISVNKKDGGKALAGYFATQDGSQIETQQIREMLLKTLPSYMVPSFLIQVEDIPLTVNGKLDRRALPVPEESFTQKQQAVTPPRNALEAELVKIWEDVLGVQGLGIDRNYFELGGDSISGIRLLAKLKDAGFHFTLQDILRLQTIRDLSEQLKDERENIENHVALTEPFALLNQNDQRLIPSGIVDAYPATMLQLGMIYHSDLDPKQAVFHDLASYHLELELNLELLTKAIEIMIQRHEILRTSFDLQNYSVPMQLVHERVEPFVRYFDISDLNWEKQESIIEQWLEDEKSNNFDWKKAPIMRFFIHKRGKNNFNFSLSFNHAILDGWSLASITSRLFQDYLEMLQGNEPLPYQKLNLSFRDYVKVELQERKSQEAKEFWEQKLENFTFCHLPRNEQGKMNSRWSETILKFSKEELEKLTEIAKKCNVSLKHVLLASHIHVLSLISKTQDVLTGVFANGRLEQNEGDKVVGLFLNTIPFRLQLTEVSWKEFFKQVLKSEQEVIPFRRYPLACIQKDFNGKQLFEVAFNFTQFHIYSENLKDDDFQIFGDIKWFEHADFTLLVNFGVNVFTSALNITLNANGAILSQNQLEIIANIYKESIQTILNDCDESIFNKKPSIQRRLEELKSRPLLECNNPAFTRQSLSVQSLKDSIKTPEKLLTQDIREMLYSIFHEVYREQNITREMVFMNEDMTWLDSLSTLRIVALIEQRLGVRIPLSLFLQEENPLQRILHLLES